VNLLSPIGGNVPDHLTERRATRTAEIVGCAWTLTPERGVVSNTGTITSRKHST
jgi:hypothetical protein